MECRTCVYYGAYRKGECDLVGTMKVYENPDMMFDIRTRVDDDSGLNVSLKVGPLFGCIWHTPKG